MNYQYHHDGTTTRYTVNGIEYTSLEDVPEEHRAHFINMDKNKNGIPDNIEPLLASMNGGKTSITKVIGALFKSVGEQMTEDASLEEVKEVKEVKEIKEQPKTNLYLQEKESSFMPTIIKILVVVFIGLMIAWYFTK
ncbi:MAG TPA: hypothetical protein VFE50_23155 [Cyclobacteriaceae bacterium]|nr:hypothetical protein [Cyclobacteriaceae bacterium]